MKNEITHDGVLDINGYIINCYILKDGRRVISGRGMQEALKLVDIVPNSDQPSGTRILRLLGQKSLEPFIYKGKEQGHYDPIICYKGKTKINGYEATVLVDICDSMLEARNSEIILGPRQEIVANQCEILIRAFAKVGITALIDEATGYQYEREKNELQKILSSYISEETVKWQLTFKMDFYKELFRLWGQPFNPNSVKKPSFVGMLTNKFIYKALPKGVLEILKENTPKTESGNYKYRLHQSLTPEIGREHLKTQIIEVTVLMSVCDTKEQFLELFNKKYADIYQHSLLQ